MGVRGRLVPLALVVVGALVAGCSWGPSPGTSATAAPANPVDSATEASTTPALSVPVARELPFAQYGDAVDTLLGSTLDTADDQAAWRTSTGRRPSTRSTAPRPRCRPSSPAR